MPATAERPPSGEKKFEPSNVMLAKDKLVQAIQSFDTVVLQGHTGSGKTVFGPSVFLEGLQRAHPGKNVRMLVAEPRQFLAEENAILVAKINNTKLGGDFVGFYHGDGREASDATKIVYTVNGSLKNRLQEDITLAGYDAVFLDEIHLREVDQYAIRIGLRAAQEQRKKKNMPPLKIILASADATQADGDYHGKATHIEVEGKKPRQVDQFFADKVTPLEQIGKEMGRKAAELVVQERHFGDVLGFLPGRAEIKEAMDEFNRIMTEKGLEEYKSASLTGGGGPENKALQEKLSLGNDDKSRKPIVAFATDVAETGANFKWLTKVIDSGYARIDVYDDTTGIQRLETRPTAYANFKQRLGRLGRFTEDGEYHGLYPEVDLTDETKHPKTQPPSILKSDLTSLVLSLKKMGLTDVYNLEYPEPPGKEKIDNAVKTLSLLGALKPDGSLSADGEQLSELPMDPHHAKMFVEAKKQGCVEAVGVLYGFLNNQRSVFDVKRGEQVRTKYKEFIDPTSDFITLLNVWNAYLAQGKDAKTWAEKNGLNLSVLRDVATTKRDLVGERVLKDTDLEWKHKPIDVASHKDAISSAVIAGFADKVLQRGEGMKFCLILNAAKKRSAISRLSGKV